MRKLASRFRWKAVGLALFALVAGGAGLLTVDTPVAKAASTFKALAGGGEAGVSVNLFYPKEILVHQGDTVEWTNPYEEPHTVSFGVLPPGDPAEPHDVAVAASFDGTKAFTSGFIPKGSKFNVTFTKIGGYTFVCAIHPGMEVDVYVLHPSATIPPQDDANSAATKAAIEKAIAAGNAAASQIKVPAPVSNSDGARTHTVLTGPAFAYEGSQVGVAVMKFYNPRIEIGVGDTVRWTAETFVPHTVTFLPPSGPPAGFSPFVQTPALRPFDGQDFVNGIFGGVPVFSNTTSFSMTFGKAGTYTYVCVLHADQGMAGVIVVGPPGSGGAAPGGGIRPPATGDGGLLGQSSGAWMLYSGLVMLVLGMSAGAYVSVKR